MEVRRDYVGAGGGRSVSAGPVDFSDSGRRRRRTRGGPGAGISGGGAMRPAESIC